LFDGISQYKLDHEGRIYEHSVDNVVLRDPPMQGVSPLLAGFNLIPAQQPYPGGPRARRCWRWRLRLVAAGGGGRRQDATPGATAGGSAPCTARLARADATAAAAVAGLAQVLAPCGTTPQ
jgi:hypothetical protein